MQYVQWTKDLSNRRAALIRQDNSGRVLGLLVSLDGITFAEPAPVEGKISVPPQAPCIASIAL